MSMQTSASNVPQWDIADRMRKALRHAGIGVQEIADYLDVSRNTVSTWINGRITPSTQSQRLWAMRCGVSYEWLATGGGHSGGGGEVLPTRPLTSPDAAADSRCSLRPVPCPAAA